MARTRRVARRARRGWEAPAAETFARSATIAMKDGRRLDAAAARRGGFAGPVLRRPASRHRSGRPRPCPAVPARAARCRRLPPRTPALRCRCRAGEQGDAPPTPWPSTSTTPRGLTRDASASGSRRAERHGVRKRLKRLRYLSELVAPLYKRSRREVPASSSPLRTSSATTWTSSSRRARHDAVEAATHAPGSTSAGSKPSCRARSSVAASACARSSTPTRTGAERAVAALRSADPPRPPWLADRALQRARSQRRGSAAAA